MINKQHEVAPVLATLQHGIPLACRKQPYQLEWPTFGRMQRQLRLYRNYTLLLFALWTASAATDQDTGCHLRTGFVSPDSSLRRHLLAPDTQGIAKASKPWWQNVEEVQQYILIANTKITQDLRVVYEEVLGREGRLVKYLPVNSFLVVATPQAAHRLQDLEETEAVQIFLPEYKIDPELRRHPAWGPLEDECKGGCPKVSTKHTTPHTQHHADQQGRIYLRGTFPHGVVSDLAGVTTETQLALQAACGFPNTSSCEFVAANQHHLTVAVPPQSFQSAVVALSGLPFVHWVELQAALELRNWYSASVLQSGSEPPSTYQPQADVFPFWKSGIRGSGQVIGMSDSGFDYTGCYFSDPKVPEPGHTHRKVVSYRVVGDTEDGSGHGTHVGGSLLGNNPVEPGDEAGKGNGIAPLAKLAFTDLGTELGDGFEMIKVPQGGLFNLFEHNYDNFGARLHSDSWGGIAYTYDNDCAMVDDFMWKHRDFVAVVAAGNDGNNAGQISTIGSPASSKNCIAVGASIGASRERMPGPGTSYNLYVTSDSVMEKVHVLSMESSPGNTKFDTITSPWIPFVQEEGVLFWQGMPSSGEEDAVMFDVVFADPLSGCVGEGEQLSGSSSWEADVSATAQQTVMDKVVLIEHNGDESACSFSQRLEAAYAVGAAALLIYPATAEAFGFPSMEAMMPDTEIALPIPAGGVTLSTARLVQRIMAAGEKPKLVFGAPVDLTDVPQYDDIAEFSAFGPTTDGRAKPDVIAVGGDIVSALAGQTCETVPRSGTSMAAPIIGGATALLREYLVSGYYPTGERNESNSLTPSGMLIKALMINSALQMEGVTESGLPLENAPSFRQGWGRTQLDRAVPLATSNVSLSLWFRDNVTINTNDAHSYCVFVPHASPDGLPSLDSTSDLWPTARPSNTSFTSVWQMPIRTTLTWYDPPASTAAAFTIINDLDLDIVVPQGTLNASRGAALYPDRINTVERAIVHFPISGSSYLITVTGHNVPEIPPDSEGLPYSLVLTGPEGTSVCDCNECDCSQCPAGIYDDTLAASIRSESQ